MAQVKVTFSNDDVNKVGQSILLEVFKQVDKWIDEVIAKNSIPDYAKEDIRLVLGQVMYGSLKNSFQGILNDIQVSLDNSPRLNAIHEQKGMVH